LADNDPTAGRRHLSFEEFWLAYLRDHAGAATRIVHYMAAAAAGAAVIVSVVTANFWYLPLGLAASYALGALSHCLIERNRFATRNRPLWSLACCFRMAFSALTGHLDEDIERANRV
jgi:hypothetical protein